MSDWPPRGHITTRPNHPPITDGRTGNVPPVNSPESFAKIAERMARENSDWEPGSAQRAIADGWGKQNATPKLARRTRAIDCPRCGEVKFTKRILTTVCDECRADHDRDLRLARQRRAVEIRRANNAVR